MTSQIKCCVPTCDNIESTSDCWFYEFPEDENLYDTWMKQCGILSKPSPQIRDYSIMICSSHFDGYSFRSDGELHGNAIPTQNLPAVELNQEASDKIMTQIEAVIEPSQLFVALFIDEAGKIINFSLVQYETIEKWQDDDHFGYEVAEIFTNADNSVDKEQGLLGAFFNCHSCKTTKEFGVVVMQKRKKSDELIPVVDEEQITEMEEVEYDESQLSHMNSSIEEIPIEEPPNTTNLPKLTSVKRKLVSPTVTHHQKPRKSRLIPINVTPVPTSSCDETILGIKFINTRSCNKCNFTPNDEDTLLDHVTTCNVGYLSKIGFKGGQRIRNNYICSKCKLSILHRDLMAHAEFHVKFAPYACKCTKCFATEDELAEHSQICGQHLFTCKMCHKEFVKKRDLFQHKADVHGVDAQGQPIKR